MTTLIYFLLIPPLIYLWAQSDPDTFLSWVAKLKRAWRSYLINRHGRQAADSFFVEFRKKAIQQGYSSEAIDSVFRKYDDHIVETLGTKAANDSLGEPTPTEFYY